MHAALSVFLVTLLLGKQPVEQKLRVLLGVCAEEGRGVYVVLALTNESPCKYESMTNERLTWLS